MNNGKLNILLLGGTGVMGRQLVEILSRKENVKVFVTSRKKRESNEYMASTVMYLQGNAKEFDFVYSLLHKQDFNVIVDFMKYSTVEFEKFANLYLNSSVEQYVFLSSGRVYAESKESLKEVAPRLLDVCDDVQYLQTDEYALAKARQENILLNSKKRNFTIVRPSITYGEERLQLGISEKEEWLFRALNEKSVILPEDIRYVKTTMTWGHDVALAISKLINNPKAFGEIFNITSPYTVTWEDVANIYSKTLEESLDLNVDYFYDCDSLMLAKNLNREYQIKYARRLNRSFDCSKLYDVIGEMSFITPEQGLSNCLKAFLEKNINFGTINWKTQLYFNKLTNERYSVFSLPGKYRQRYLCEKYLGRIVRLFRLVKSKI